MSINTISIRVIYTTTMFNIIYVNFSYLFKVTFFLVIFQKELPFDKYNLNPKHYFDSILNAFLLGSLS
jgi:hypothetical protein